MSSKLENLPLRVIKRIISQLSICDILNLSSTSHTMFNICNSNDVWKLIFKCHFGCYWTVHDYRKFLDYNNWKILCYEIFVRNMHRQEFIEYLSNNLSSHQNDFSDDSESETLNAAKVWPSVARTNLFATSSQKLPNQFINSDSSDCEEQILEITELHKSISSASIESFTLIGSKCSSKANFFPNAPSTSAASFNSRENILNVNESPTQNAREVNYSDLNEDVDTLGIGYTRRQIKKRLDNLVKNGFKNFSGDAEDLLPATKNGKYALHYREIHQN